MPMKLAVKVENSSMTATILAVVTALGGLIVGLGLITSSQEGLLVATTTSGIAAAGLLANAIHTGAIEPSAIVTSVVAVVAQVVALLVSFLLISEAEAAHIVVIVTAGVLAVAQVAHALISKQVGAS
jgi:hypothetical protein